MLPSGRLSMAPLGEFRQCKRESRCSLVNHCPLFAESLEAPGTERTGRQDSRFNVTRKPLRAFIQKAYPNILRCYIVQMAFTAIIKLLELMDH
jgi:hypothetical protein